MSECVISDKECKHAKKDESFPVCVHCVMDNRPIDCPVILELRENPDETYRSVFYDIGGSDLA